MFLDAFVLSVLPGHPGRVQATDHLRGTLIHRIHLLSLFVAQLLCMYLADHTHVSGTLVCVVAAMAFCVRTCTCVPVLLVVSFASSSHADLAGKYTHYKSSTP